MSWDAIKWIHNLPPDAVEPTGRQILAQLAYRHDEETGECAPGRPWLVLHTGLSERTVKTWLPRLEREGWFRSERRKASNGRDDSTQYHLAIGFGGPAAKGAPITPQGEAATPLHAPNQGEQAAPQGEASAPTRGNVLPGGGGTSYPGAGEASAPHVGEGAAPPIEETTKTPTDNYPSAPTGAGSEPNRKLLGFEDFWNAYPSNAKHNRKRYKGDAAKVFEKLKPAQATIQAMLEALAWQRESYNWRKNEGQYVPYPTRWLRAKCWLDDRPVGDVTGGRDGRGGMDTVGATRQCAEGHPLRLVHTGRNYKNWICPTCEPDRFAQLQAKQQAQSQGVA